jgi:NAD-dependent dihydropyrimidine dehydrogenase PreA subunit
MAYVIAEPCINVKDTACVDVCPVDCIHPRKNEDDFAPVAQLYIDPVECIVISLLPRLSGSQLVSPIIEGVPTWCWYSRQGEMAVLTSRFWQRSRQTMPGFWTSRRRCWPLCSVPRQEQPELRRKRTCRFLCWSMRMGEYIAAQALRTTMVTPPQQFTLPTGSARCLVCTEQQRDTQCPTCRRL